MASTIGLWRERAWQRYFCLPLGAKPFFGEVGLLAGDLADGAAGLVGLLGDLGGSVVADLGRHGESTLLRALA
jgi:hypothetical protein